MPAPRPDLELRQLRAFLAVVDHGGVTAAPRALGVAQSTVSEALLALDRALGTPLLARGRRPALTEAGLHLLTMESVEGTTPAGPAGALVEAVRALAPALLASSNS